MYSNLLEILSEDKRLRVKYITVIYLLCMVFSAFFQSLHFFLYKYYDYNWLLWPLYIFGLINPLISRITKSYNITAITLLMSASLQLLVLLYTAGAMQAPGIFWITVIPISCGVLLGRQGAIFGAGVVVLTCVFFVIAQFSWEVPNVVQNMEDFEKQRIMSFVCFCVFAIWLVFYFLSHEAKAQVEIRKHKSEIESLLHILIHDVASPLVVMEMDVQRLKRSLKEAELGKSVERMERNLKNVVELLKHIREMKAVRDGKIGFDTHPVNFDLVLKSSLEVVKSRADEKQIQIVNKTELNNCYILGDETLLQNIVLVNLLVNAIKFSPLCEKIVVSGHSDSDKIYFEIQDYGIGIPEYILKNIFSLTYRTSRAGTGGEKGTGYGMLLVKEYVEKMGGQISITSNELGSGTGPSGTIIRLVFSKFDNVNATNTIKVNETN